MMLLQRPLSMSQVGFTLIELVISILILGVTSAAIIQLNGNLFRRSDDIKKIQNANLVLQACMDRIVGIRKAAVDVTTLTASALNASCQTIPTLDSSITVTVTAVTPVSTLCPTSCVQFQIRATGTGLNTPYIPLLFAKN